MATPDTKHSVVVKKSFPYRDGAKIWSNRYHFEGDLPPSDAAWGTFADHIVAAEKLIYADDVTITEVVGYDASSASSTNPHGLAVYAKSYAVPGTLETAGTHPPAPGDCAALLRYSTPARSVKNHPVYLFNYFHGALLFSAGGDNMWSGQETAIGVYADAWITGFSDGAEVHERCGPRGAVATGRFVQQYLTHRDFPR